MSHTLSRAATGCALWLLALTASAGCTPKLGEEVPLQDFFTKADLDGKYVTTTGLVTLASGIAQSTSCTRVSCNIDLLLVDWETRPRGDRKSVAIEVDVGTGENEMAELPDSYSKADLKVKAMGGKVLAYGDKVKVSGNLHCKNGSEPSLPCKMRVERIDAL